MIIDVHSHLIPMHHRSGNEPRQISDVEALWQQQAEAGVDVSILSNSMISMSRDVVRTKIDAVKEWNAWAAEFAAHSNGRIIALAGANPFGGPEFVKEAERAILRDGMKGIVVNSSVDGEYLDSPAAFPVYELACELDVPIFIHPPAFTIGVEKMRDFRLIEMIGRPFDTTLSVARLILFGVLERYPKLKLVLAHMGGAMMMLPGRLDFGYALRNDRAFGPWEPDVLSKPPSEYIRQLYVDTMGFHTPGAMCAVATVGVEHVLFGSDFPPVSSPPLRCAVDVVRNLPLAQVDRQKILGENAARLFKLSSC